MKLWKKGLIIIAFSIIFNAAFMNLNVGGLLRELSRITTLSGIVIAIVGLITKK